MPAPTGGAVKAHERPEQGRWLPPPEPCSGLLPVLSLLLIPGSPWQVGSIIPVAELEVEARGDWVTCLGSQQDVNAGPPGVRAEFLSNPPTDVPVSEEDGRVQASGA